MNEEYQKSLQDLTKKLKDSNREKERFARIAAQRSEQQSDENIIVTHAAGIKTVGAVNEVRDETVKTNSLFTKYFDKLKSQEGLQQERDRELKDAISKIGAGSGGKDTKKEEENAKESFLGKKGFLFRFAAFIGGLFAVRNLRFLTKSLKGAVVGYFRGQFKIFKTLVFKPFKAFGKGVFKFLGKIGRAMGLGKIMDSAKLFGNNVGGKFSKLGKFLTTPFTKLSAATTAASKNADAIIKSFNKTANMTKNNTKTVKGLFGKTKTVSTAVTSVGQMKAFKGAGIGTKALVKGKQFAGAIKGGLASVGDIPKPKGVLKFFKFFGKMLKGVPLLGQILTILDGVIGSFKGFFAFKDEGLLMGIFGASTGFIRGILVGFIGFFGDLLKNGISFIFRKIGLGFISDFLDKFSFTDMINNFFDKVMDTIGTFIMNIKDAFKNGFAKGIVILGLKLQNMINNLIKFPKAILAGGISALGALLPGGKTPKEAFAEGFNKSMQKSADANEARNTAIKALGGKDAEGIAAEREALRESNKKKREDRKKKNAADKEKRRLEKLEKEEADRLLKQQQQNGALLNSQGNGYGGGATVVDASSRTGGSVTNNNQRVTNNYYGNSGNVGAQNSGGYASSAYGLG